MPRFTLRAGFAVALLVVLSACGAPRHSAERPRADDFNCGRVEGQMTCADSTQTPRNPSNMRDF